MHARIARWRVAAVTVCWCCLLVSARAQTTAGADFNKTFKHYFVEVNGLRLHYVMGGKGEAVVLLHGYPQTWYGWRKVMPLLAQKYTVIVPDMRGLGQSSRPQDGDYTKKSVADDIYQLTRILHLARLYVAGQDMGGPVAYAFAAQHPQAVIKMVQIDTGIPGFGLEAAMNPAQGGSWHFGFFAAPEFPEMLTKGREKAFLTKFAFRSPYVYQKSSITEADIDTYLRSYVAPGGMTAGFGYYRAFPQDAKDNRELGKTKLTLPVLAVGGEHGLGNFTLDNMKLCAENVRGVLIKECGHFVYDEQPEQLAKEMMTFFQEDTP
jgi:pimeloyl-ACP methyl ester carboxylesterase